MRKRTLATALLLVMIILLTPNLTHGQSSPGSPSPPILGFIYDTDGETLLSGAQVTLTNQRTNESILTLADDGSYLADINDFSSGFEEGDSILVSVILADRIGDNTTVIILEGVPFNQCDVYTISEKPRIDHLPLTTVDEGGTTTFSAIIVDDIGVAGAELRIWNDSWEDPILGPEGMEQDGNTWSVSINIPSDINSIYWPGFYYNISAFDGRYTVSTPTQYTIVNDAIAPTIFWNSSDVPEKVNLTITPTIYDNHGLVGASLTYRNENITLDLPPEWNGSATLEGTIPGVDVRVPEIVVTVNVWDNNNTRRETYPITVKDTTPPTTINNFEATPSVLSLNITLSWGKPTDNVGVVAYLIERSTDETNWDWSIETTPNEQTYTDVEGTANTHYYYRIRARDAEYNLGEATYANTTTADLLPPTITHTAQEEWDEGEDLPLTTTIVDLDGTVTAAYLWYDNGSYEDTITLVSAGNEWTGAIPGTNMGPATISNDSEGLVYKIMATDGTNWRETRQFHVWIRDNIPPTTFNLSVSLDDTKPYLTWEESKDDLQVVEYRLVVNTTPITTPTGPYEIVQWGRGYTYDSALPGTHYYFAISAYDGRNTGPWVFVNITTPAPLNDTTPPQIVHNAPTSAMEKENLALEAKITDDEGVAEATVTYWKNSIGDGGSIYLNYAGNNSWKGILPFSALVGENINYTITSSDHSGNIATSGTATNPYTVELISRDVAITTTPSIQMNMTPGDVMSFDIIIATNANATWYAFLDLEGIESYNATLENHSIPLDGTTPIFLEIGAYELNITIVFPLERKTTAVGTLYINQTDASSTAKIALLFEGEEIEGEEPLVPPALLYLFVVGTVGMLVVGALMSKRLHPKRK